MDRGNVLILTALYFEAAPIVRRLDLRFTSRTTAVGTAPSGPQVHLHIVGPGAGHLPPHPPPGPCLAVIMAGLAGALAPELKRSDVVVDEQSTVPADLHYRCGRIATVDSIVATPTSKADLYRTTGASVVDMENARARDWAERHRIPFVGIRAVSDTAEETLEPACMRVIDDRGFLRPTRLVATILGRPYVLPAFWRLRSSGQVASDLAREVQRLVECLSSPAETTRPRDS